MKNRILFSTIGLFALIVLLSRYFYLGRRQSVENWAIFTPELSPKISLKYPRDLFIKVFCKGEEGNTFAVGLATRTMFPEERGEEVIDESCGIRAEYYTVQIESFARLSPEKFNNFIVAGVQSEVKREEVKLGQYTFLKYSTFPKTEVDPGSHLFQRLPGEFALVNYEDKTYLIRFPGSSDLFNKILMTVEFK